MSDDGRRALTRYTKMEGTAFLEGRAMLKGGGAITDFESKKAEAAFARLSRSLSESDAREALNEFKEAVQAGVEKLRAKARGGSAPSAAAPTATPQRIRLNADGTVVQ
jgi:flagellar protein FlgJ